MSTKQIRAEPESRLNIYEAINANNLQWSTYIKQADLDQAMMLAQ